VWGEVLEFPEFDASPGGMLCATKRHYRKSWYFGAM